ncbi:uncharacterized protein LOC117194748 isoform X4 [Drosophila miranda]|uniref:uncharacterized protein LOC117194748 isoform X4 n=1 Tax=Drosophila miranda TaxID=7229 RepID=UPI00143FA7B8|nr:uncharacterized protein LOC117194748 isoform X4 [Drosophila miranda]
MSRLWTHSMTNGTIQLRLRDGVRIDMTLDKAVRVLNQRSMVAVALSRNCSNSALIHPNGRIFQSGAKVEIVTYDGMKGNNFVRYAKMWYKGVSFTSEACASHLPGGHSRDAHHNRHFHRSDQGLHPGSVL